jgi:hypothetical protein
VVGSPLPVPHQSRKSLNDFLSPGSPGPLAEEPHPSSLCLWLQRPPLFDLGGFSLRELLGRLGWDHGTILADPESDP